MRDALAQYLFAGHAVRAALVDISSGLEAMLGQRDYAAGVRQLVGEALAAAPLLASHLKFEGRINLQFQGAAGLTLLVAQIDDQLTVRGMAKAAQGIDGDFPSLTKGGRLSVLLEPHRSSTRYEGIVPLDGENLAAALASYYRQSEQLPTRLCLAAGLERLCGLLIQRMPAVGGADALASDVEGSDNAYWAHIEALFATLASAELLAQEPEEIIHRLFHAETLTAFAPRPVSLACHCTRASVSRLLLALGQAELEQLLAEQGQVEVRCEFCGRQHVYSKLDIRELLAARDADVDGATQH